MSSIVSIEEVEKQFPDHTFEVKDGKLFCDGEPMKVRWYTNESLEKLGLFNYHPKGTALEEMKLALMAQIRVELYVREGMDFADAVNKAYSTPVFLDNS